MDSETGISRVFSKQAMIAIELMAIQIFVFLTIKYPFKSCIILLNMAKESLSVWGGLGNFVFFDVLAIVGGFVWFLSIYYL